MGSAYLPGKFADICTERSIRCIQAAPGEFSQAIRFVKQDGVLVLAGDWARVREFCRDILSRESELLPSPSNARERKQLSRKLRMRILTTTDCIPALSELFERTEIAGFLGEESLPDDAPILIPVTEAERLLEIPKNTFAVRAAEAEFAVHPDVLAPQSQETVDLICKAIKLCEPHMPDQPKVLDMGCGSGVLAVVAWRALAHKSPHITVSDILPEAVACTRYNWRRLSEQGKVGLIEALTAACGDLFDPLNEQVFDLIIFNAPWVAGSVRSRADLALVDENQRTVTRFLESCPTHLRKHGMVILAYASNAGPEAILRLEQSIEAVNLNVIHCLKERIHTRRAKRQWQSVYAYVLARAESS